MVASLTLGSPVSISARTAGIELLLSPGDPNVSIKTTPNHLRIHRAPNDRDCRPVDLTNTNVIDGFWRAYTEATGWRVDLRASRQHSRLELLPAIVSDAAADADAAGSLPNVTQTHAKRLAAAASKLSQQLRDQERAIRLQEAELAARAAIVVGDDSRTKLADQIESTLADAVAACHCDAAVMYLLDDDTQYLKARSVFGMPASRLTQPPRELRGCRADLEALVQGVVAIDDLHGGPLDTWKSPEPFAAGICASINHNELPIGTLWLFANEPRKFSDAEAAAARLSAANIAGRLANQSDSSRVAIAEQTPSPVSALADWQLTSLPMDNQLAPGWRVDAVIDSPNDYAVGWHHWDVLPDGTLMFAIAESDDHSAAGALASTLARGVLMAHLGYRHTCKQLLQRVSDTLWQTNGEQSLSMLYGQIQPETGDVKIASAGKLHALISSDRGVRPVVATANETLGQHPDPQLAVAKARVTSGESLIIASGCLSQNAIISNQDSARRGARRLGTLASPQSIVDDARRSDLENELQVITVSRAAVNGQKLH